MLTCAKARQQTRGQPEANEPKWRIIVHTYPFVEKNKSQHIKNENLNSSGRERSVVDCRKSPTNDLLTTVWSNEETQES
jgi:hypothetical protein